MIRAASNGRADVIVELVKAGANLDLQNKVHNLIITPLIKLLQTKT